MQYLNNPLTLNKFNLSDLHPKYKNSLKTALFYGIYFIVAFIFWFLLPSGICAPGLNAILILALPFVAGSFTIINLFKIYFDRNLIISLAIHSLFFIICLSLISF
jgi:hypothetical protein